MEKKMKEISELETEANLQLLQISQVDKHSFR